MERVKKAFLNSKSRNTENPENLINTLKANKETTMKFKRLNEDEALTKEVFAVMDKVWRKNKVPIFRANAQFGDESEVSFELKSRCPARLYFCARGSGNVLDVVEEETYFHIPDQSVINSGNIKRDLIDKENYFSDVSRMIVTYKEMIDAVSEVLEENGYKISDYTVGMR